MPGYDEMLCACSALIGEIYEAGLDPSRWEAVIAGAAALLGGSSGLVYGLDAAPQQAAWFGHHFPAEAMERYVGHYRLTNVWAQEMERIRIPTGCPVLTESLVDAGRLERSEFYVDYLAELGIHKACTVQLHKDDVTQVESHLCVYRPRSAASFDADAAQWMQLLVPHLQRAQRIRATLSQLDQRARNVSAALDALSAGVVLLSRQGTVLHLNTTAEAIVRAQDGLSVRHGRLSAPRAVETQALARLVDRVCGRQGAPVGGALQLARTSGKRPLQLVATPLSMSVSALGSHRVDVDLNAVALCFISGHEHQTQDAHAVLPQIFGLTPSETRLAVSLLDGGSLTEFAARHGVSVNTAKTQLASLFAKTGAHRQGEVVTILRAACGHLRVAAGGEARISRP